MTSPAVAGVRASSWVRFGRNFPKSPHPAPTMLRCRKPVPSAQAELRASDFSTSIFPRSTRRTNQKQPEASGWMTCWPSPGLRKARLRRSSSLRPGLPFSAISQKTVSKVKKTNTIPYSSIQKSTPPIRLAWDEEPRAPRPPGARYLQTPQNPPQQNRAHAMQQNVHHMIRQRRQTPKRVLQPEGRDHQRKIPPHARGQIFIGPSGPTT